MKKPILLLAVLALLVFPGCGLTFNLANSDRVTGSGDQATESREVSGFDQVSLNVPSTLYIEQGAEESLTIEADDNVIPLIVTEVNGSQLTIKLKDNTNLNLISRIVFRLTVKELSKVEINGSGRVESTSLDVADLDLRISGSGDFAIDTLNADSLVSHIDGSGKVVIAGSAPKVEVRISGSGNFNCPDLEANDTTVNIDGSGNVTVWAKDSLDVRISGSGAVRYYGSPTVDQSISGSGSIKHQGDK